jgi:hypothetical protein
MSKRVRSLSQDSPKKKDKKENIKDKMMMILISAHGNDHVIEQTLREKIKNDLLVMGIYFTLDEALKNTYINEIMQVLENMDIFYVPAMTAKNASAPMKEQFLVGKEIAKLNGNYMSTRDLYILKFLFDCNAFIESHTEINLEQFQHFVQEHSRNQRELFFYLNADDYIEILNLCKSYKTAKNKILDNSFPPHDGEWKHEYLPLCCSKNSTIFDIHDATIDHLQFDPRLAKVFKTYRSRPNVHLRTQTNLFLEQKWEHISTFFGENDAEEKAFKFSLQVIDPTCFQRIFAGLTKENMFTSFDLNSPQLKMFDCLNAKLSTLGHEPGLIEFKRHILTTLITKIVQDMTISQSQLFIILALFNLQVAFITDSDCTDLPEDLKEEDIKTPEIRRTLKKKPKHSKKAKIRRVRIQPYQESQLDIDFQPVQDPIENIISQHQARLKEILLHTVNGNFGGSEISFIEAISTKKIIEEEIQKEIAGQPILKRILIFFRIPSSLPPHYKSTIREIHRLLNEPRTRSRDQKNGLRDRSRSRDKKIGSRDRSRSRDRIDPFIEKKAKEIKDKLDNLRRRIGSH